MKIAIAGDHAGFLLKDFLQLSLKESECLEIIDLGAFDEKPSDYPDFAEKIGEALQTGKAERGILICGSGVGASVAANKIPGIRAGLCHDHYSAHQGVEHDDMNVLVLGARIIGEAVAADLADAFIRARFTNRSRHLRRLQKITAIEQKSQASPIT